MGPSSGRACRPGPGRPGGPGRAGSSLSLSRSLIYIYIYICVYTYVERERERDMDGQEVPPGGVLYTPLVLTPFVPSEIFRRLDKISPVRA